MSLSRVIFHLKGPWSKVSFLTQCDYFWIKKEEKSFLQLSWIYWVELRRINISGVFWVKIHLKKNTWHKSIFMFLLKFNNSFIILRIYSILKKRGLYSSSLLEVLCKTGFLRNFGKFTGKDPCQNLLINYAVGI